MIYASMTFWLLVVVLTAWGVHRLWGQMIKPKVFNTILLPGTLVAQLGHVIGLLITGATISNTTLIADDESGDEAGTPQQVPPADEVHETDHAAADQPGHRSGEARHAGDGVVGLPHLRVAPGEGLRHLHEVA